MRSDLGLTNGQLGLLLLALAAGSVLSLPTTGALINRFGTVRRGPRRRPPARPLGLLRPALGAEAGLVPLDGAWGCSPTASAPATWDVAMNVEGAAVERALGPHDHAALPRGLQPGHGARRRLGALLVWPRRADAGPPRRLVAVGALRAGVGPATGVPPASSPSPRAAHVSALERLAGAAHADDRADGASRSRSPRAPPTTGSRWRWWTATTSQHWVGVAGFALFVTSMTRGPAGRAGAAGPLRPAGGALVDDGRRRPSACS